MSKKVSQWLDALGLSQYTDSFTENEVGFRNSATPISRKWGCVRSDIEKRYSRPLQNSVASRLMHRGQDRNGTKAAVAAMKTSPPGHALPVNASR
jgi:hypothetical protein